MITYRLNRRANEKLKSLVANGKFNDDPWRFTPEVSNELLQDPPNWTWYADSFLGRDAAKPTSIAMNGADGLTPDKSWYDFPYTADGVSANLNALREIVRTAPADIARAAEDALSSAEQQQRDRAQAAFVGDIALKGFIDLMAARDRTGAPNAVPKINIVAYNGGPMALEGWTYPVVVDLAGLDYTAHDRPILRDHDGKRAIGHVEAITNDGQRLIVEGVLSWTSEDAREVLEAARNNFPFQASVGVKVEKQEFVPAGQTATANGRTFKGPVTIARRGSLREISIVSLGADDDSSAKIAAHHAPAALVRSTPSATTAILEAAACLSAGIPEREVETRYAPQTLDAARRFGRMGFKKLISNACDLDGRPAPSFTANAADFVQAGMSTISLPVLLSNVANVSLAAAFNAVRAAAPRIANYVDLTSLKRHTRYRLVGDGSLQPDKSGEIQQQTLSELTATIDPQTYGRVCVLDRQTLINDDIGAFNALFKIFGRASALAVEKALTLAILANANAFFSAGNKNLISGGSSALATAGLAKAMQQLREQKDGGPSNEMVMIAPHVLLVPPALETTALQLQRLTAIDGLSPEDAAQSNAGSLIPVVGSYLGAAGSLASASDTGWYLLGDKADVPPFEVGFLYGRQVPEIEQAPAEMTQVGTAFKVVFDFGVCMAEPRAAVFNVGA